MWLQKKNVAKVGPNSHFRANGYTMPAMDTSIGNLTGSNGDGIRRAIFFTLQATRAFLEKNKWHNNQILMAKGTKNKVQSA